MPGIVYRKGRMNGKGQRLPYVGEDDSVLPFLQCRNRVGADRVVAPYGINAAYRNRPAVYLPPCFPFFIPAKKYA